MNYPPLAVLGYGVLIAIVILKLFSSKYIFRSKVPLQVPPGSMGWPLLGETLGFIQPHNCNSLGKFLQERCFRYGKVFRSHIFGAPTIVSCDPELNTFILKNEGRLFFNNLPTNLKKIFGEQSIVVVSGQDHKRLRSLAVSFMNTFNITPDFLFYMENSVIEMIDQWKKDDQNEIEFFKEAKELNFYLLLKRVLDVNKGDVNETIIKKELFINLMGLTSFPIYFPGNAYDKAVRARKRLDSILTRIISEKMKCGPTGYGAIDHNKEFVNEKLMKDDLNDGEKAMVVRLLLGGYQTTSELMAVVVYFLALFPSAFQEMKEEHMSLRKGKKEGEPLGLEDYKKMNFTLKVINESLRCGNLLKSVPRKAIKDVIHKGFLIPSGWQVLPIFSATHMDSSLHENPCEFNPWRWNDEDTRRNVTPFGGGPRLCPGAEFAKLLTAFFFHHFILRYNWKIRSDECPILCPFPIFKREMRLELFTSTIG